MGEEYTVYTGSVDPVDFFLEARQLAHEIIADDGSALSSDHYMRACRMVEMSTELRGMQFTYSGIGNIPTRNHLGNLLTIHSDVSYRTGVFRQFGVVDFSDLQCQLPGDVDIELDAGSLAQLPDDIDGVPVANIKAFYDSLKTPPKGFRLMAEFVIEHHEDLDQPVFGHGIRATGLMLADSMDVSTLDIFSVQDADETSPAAEVWHLGPTLEDFHVRYRSTLRSPLFRNASIRKQQEFMDLQLEYLNELLGVDRFTVETESGTIYQPTTKFPLGEEKVVEQEFDVFPAPRVSARCLRVDCVERSLLENGRKIMKRKGNFDSNASVCLVVELDEEHRQAAGLSSTIVWIPVAEHIDTMAFAEKQVL